MTEQLATMQAILDKIEQYDRIIISRHIRPDGDAIGSTKGFGRVLKLTYPDKDIHVVCEDKSDYLAFLGDDEPQLPDEMYDGALAIVFDTATQERISNGKIGLAKELIKIDHHINIQPYGELMWVEDRRSSVCEMVAYFLQTFADRLVVDKQAATYVYTGMVTDSGRFRYESTTGETLRLAGMLLDYGVDTDTLFANLYLEDFDYFKFEALIHKKMRITPAGVAHVHVTNAIQTKLGLTTEQASEAVSFLNSIKGSIVWIAFIDMPDGTIRVRLRSRFIEINTLAEKYRGGGHQCTCGATLLKRSEIALLLADADKMVADYKATHEGWL